MTRIPEKLYFKIGEVARIAHIKPYVLRYWESEFNALRPQKSTSRQRVYTRRDIERVLEIKRLLYEEKYTIDGAKKRIAEGLKETKTGGRTKRAQAELPFANSSGHDGVIKAIKKELLAIKKILSTGA